MNYPTFFDSIETIKLQDDLSNFLGTFENGVVEFSYLDIVKSAGHSCPTVAGAYIMVLIGLKELYKDSLPKRGEIIVSFKEDQEYGVAGVISNVVTHITGATENNGFKGLNNKFKRHGLMEFNAEISTSIKFQRADTKKAVELIYNPNIILPDPQMSLLMEKLMKNTANETEKKEFGKQWQNRVERIFKNIDKVITLI